MTPRPSLLRRAALAATALVGLGALAVFLDTPAARAERALEATIEARSRLACPDPQPMPSAPAGAVSSDGRWGILTDFGRHTHREGTFDGNRAAVIDMAAKRVRHMVDLGANRGAHGVAFVPGTSRAVITTQSSRTVVVNVATGASSGSATFRAAPSGCSTPSAARRSTRSTASRTPGAST